MNQSTNKSREGTILNRIALYVSFALALTVAIVLLEQFGWFFSVFSNFREWYFLFSLLLLSVVPFCPQKKVWIGAVSIVTLSINFFAIAPFNQGLLKKQEGFTHPQQMTMLFVNLNSQNSDRNKFIDYVKTNTFEVLLLAEVNSEWMAALQKLEAEFPFTKAIVQEGNFGMAVMSKTPLVVKNYFVDRERLIPALFLETQSRLGAFNLVLLHAHPPIGEFGTRLRNQYLDFHGRRIGELNAPTLVCGDFNETPWNFAFQNFLNLSNTEYPKDFSALRTWPVGLPFWKLPIDHCLTKDLKVLSYSAGPNIGSDHLPILVRIAPIGNREEAQEQVN